MLRAKTNQQAFRCQISSIKECQVELSEQTSSQMLLLSNNALKVFQIILLQKHEHLEMSIIQTLAKTVQAEQESFEHACPEVLQYLQQIQQKDIFQMVIQEIKCKICSKSCSQYLMRHFDKLLLLIVWYKQRSFSSLEAYIEFLKLNQALFTRSSHKPARTDSLWNDSIKKLVKDSEQHIQKPLYEFRKSMNEERNVLSILSTEELKQIHKNAYQSVKEQLYFYQISFQLFKIYQGANQQQSSLNLFYQKYIKPVKPTFGNKLIILAKMIESTYKNSKFQALIQLKLLYPLKKKIENAYPFVMMSKKQKQLEQQKSYIKMKSCLQTESQITKQSDSITKNLSYAEPKNKPIQQLQQDGAKKVIQKQPNQQLDASTSTNVTTIQELQQSFTSLQNNSTLPQQKTHILSVLKEIKIKNLQGNRLDKEKMAQSLLQASRNQPELVNAAFQNSLTTFAVQQLPQKLKSLYKQSSEQVKHEYQKYRQQLKDFKSLFQKFNLQ